MAARRQRLADVTCRSADQIEASFKNGVLMVTLPKSAQAQKTAKKIDVKAA